MKRMAYQFVRWLLVPTLGIVMWRLDWMVVDPQSLGMLALAQLTWWIGLELDRRLQEKERAERTLPTWQKLSVRRCKYDPRAKRWDDERALR